MRLSQPLGDCRGYAWPGTELDSSKPLVCLVPACHSVIGAFERGGGEEGLGRTLLWWAMLQSVKKKKQPKQLSEHTSLLVLLAQDSRFCLEKNLLHSSCSAQVSSWLRQDPKAACVGVMGSE